MRMVRILLDNFQGLEEGLRIVFCSLLWIGNLFLLFIASMELYCIRLYLVPPLVLITRCHYCFSLFLQVLGGSP